jgi:anti-sigma regulatory factor (Ser/Thr protein kinase)
VLLTVRDRSKVGEARRQAIAVAGRAGLAETDTGRVGLLATELASNLLKHALGGVLVIRAVNDGWWGVEVLALDRGPGMPEPEGCFRDGQSTSGSLGIGLGAVRRLSTDVDVYSVVPSGTALLARIVVTRATARERGTPFDVGAISVPKPGQEVCGDGWAALQDGTGACWLLVADGLGHGLAAAEAARLAERAFRESAAPDPAARLADVHLALRGSRGAAVAVVRVDGPQRLLRFAGVGNVAGAVLTGTTRRHVVSLGGTAGHEAPRIMEFAYPWPPGSVLILHTDGLGSRWDLHRYPGLAERHPSLVAAVLYRDFARGNDDVTVVVAREAAAA